MRFLWVSPGLPLFSDLLVLLEHATGVDPQKPHPHRFLEFKRYAEHHDLPAPGFPL